MNLHSLPLLALHAEANAAVVRDRLNDSSAGHRAGQVDAGIDARIVRLETHVGAALVFPDRDDKVLLDALVVARDRTGC